MADLEYPGGSGITTLTDSGLISNDPYLTGLKAPSSAYQMLFSELRKAIVPDYILIRDKQSASSVGGTYSTGGVTITRVLNEIAYDAGGHASLASNQFTLAAGTYAFRGGAPMLAVDNFQTWLYNVTDATEQESGSPAYSGTGTNYAALYSYFEGLMTIASSKTFEIRQVARTANTSGGALGANQGSGVTGSTYNIFAFIQLWKTA